MKGEVATSPFSVNNRKDKTKRDYNCIPIYLTRKEFKRNAIYFE